MYGSSLAMFIALSIVQGLIKSAWCIFFLLNMMLVLTTITIVLWILGNHDLKKIANSNQIKDYFADINMQMRVVVDKQKMLLNHYPFLCFEGGYQNVWQLFGHVHSSKHSTGLDKERLVHLFPTQYDVGVDNNNYRPVSFSQVSQIITEQQANAHK